MAFEQSPNILQWRELQPARPMGDITLRQAEKITSDCRIECAESHFAALAGTQIRNYRNSSNNFIYLDKYGGRFVQSGMRECLLIDPEITIPRGTGTVKKRERCGSVYWRGERIGAVCERPEVYRLKCWAYFPERPDKLIYIDKTNRGDPYDSIDHEVRHLKGGSMVSDGIIARKGTFKRSLEMAGNILARIDNKLFVIDGKNEVVEELVV